MTENNIAGTITEQALSMANQSHSNFMELHELAQYWMKRCEAAEYLLSHVDVGINKRFVGWKEWQDIKNNPPK